MLAFLVFRPLAQTKVAPEDRRRAEDLVHAYGSDTLCLLRAAGRQEPVLLVRRPGDGRLHLPSGRARLRRPDRRPGVGPLVVDEFAAFCHERGWRVAYLAVRESDLPLYEARGMKAMYLGDEAIIRCDRIDIHGPGMKKLRGAVSASRATTRSR